MEILERWVREHQAVVYRAACLILRDPRAAEDIAQETFLRAARAADRRNPGAEVRPWLYRIAVNLSLDRLRSQRRERRALDRLATLPESGHHGDELFEHRMRRVVIAEALERLPDRLRVPVILRYYLDLSEEDIARSMGIRRGTVKSRLHAARLALAGDESIVAVGQAG